MGTEKGWRGSQGHVGHWQRDGWGLRDMLGSEEGGGGLRDMLGMTESWRWSHGHVGHGKGVGWSLGHVAHGSGVEGVSQTSWAGQRGGGGLRDMLGM